MNLFQNKMSEPVDKNLYNKVKEEAKRTFRVWPSAYGSQWLVKTYKYRGGKYRSSRKSSRKSSRNLSGLIRWNREKWKDEKGNVCGSKKNRTTKKCRPTKKISSKTPVTWHEMTRSQRRSAVREKKKIGMGRRTTSIKKK